MQQHLSEVFRGLSLLALLFSPAGVGSAQPCASGVLLEVELVGLGLPKEGRGVTGWKKPAPKPVYNLMVVQAYIWAGLGRSLPICVSKVWLKRHRGCTPGIVLIHLGSVCSRALVGTHKTHRNTWLWYVGTHHNYVADNFAFFSISVSLGIAGIMSDSQVSYDAFVNAKSVSLWQF